MNIPAETLPPTSSQSMGYARRAIRFVEPWRHRGWQFKIYGINPDLPAAGRSVVEPASIGHAKGLAVLRLTEARRADEEGFGFLIVHQGHLARWVLVDCWRERILLDHWLHKADLGSPDRFELMTDGLCACVWELRVIEFERQAWTRCVLRAGAAPDYAAYMDARLDEDC